MQFGNISKTILFSLLLTATFAFAASNDLHKGSFDISDPSQVNGTTLKPGTYSVQWSGTGPSVEVSIVSGGKVLAKAMATIVEGNEKASDDAVETSTKDGVRTVKLIRFSGKKYSLQIGGDSAKAGADKDSTGNN